MDRRTFLSAVAATGTGAAAYPLFAAEKRPPRVLLRSSWQVVNIGDIAHTPGVLALLEKYVPEAEVVLWASGDLSPAVAAMEHKRFPKLKIVKGSLGADGKASNPDLGEAVARADFLLHGSGASLVAAKDVAAFTKQTGKPFGVYGITHGAFLSGDDKPLLDRARFVFFRDTVSQERARKDGVTCPVMEFGPDGAFAVDVTDDEAATAFLRKHGLEDGKFLVTIPRLRYTPYWKIRNKEMTATDKTRWARSQAMKEADHAKLCEAVVAFVRKTGMKVLVCPEDRSQMEVGKENVVDKLPDDVKAKTVWREDFWLTDEAVSVYARAFALLSLEMHSPIMAAAQGVPTVLCRFEEQTSKGFMWRDIGLGDWLFDLDREKDGSNVTTTLMGIVADPAAARAKVAKAMAFVRRRQQETMAVLRKELGV